MYGVSKGDRVDINLASIMKAGLVLAFLLPAFALVAGTLPNSAPILNNPTQQPTTNLSIEMNSTSLYIQSHFLRTVSGLNKTLLSTNGSFNANPTIFQAFAFIVSGFGTIMQDFVMLPYLDFASMNFLIYGMQFAFPPYAISFMKVGMDLLNGYLIFSMGVLGISMIEKYDAKSG